jgi:hypothetical protein
MFLMLQALAAVAVSLRACSAILMARHVVLLRLDIYLHHMHSVIVVLRQYAAYNTNPGSALHTLA